MRRQLKMKTRFDFVSNSSSCSFIVNDMESFMSTLKKLSTSSRYGLDTWWMNGFNVSFNFQNTSENRLAFKNFVNNHYDYNDINDKTLYVNCDFEQLFSIDKSNYSQMKDISVYANTDDSKDTNARLALLYWAMKAENVDVDNSCSEREFEIFSDVPAGIVNAAMTKFQPKQEFN